MSNRIVTNTLPGTSSSFNRMASLPLNSDAGSTYYFGCHNRRHNAAVRYMFSHCGLTFQALGHWGRDNSTSHRKVFVCRQSIQAQGKQLRKCSPFLEKELFGNDVAVSSGEWKTIPDIWRTAAEKFADRVALVDKYHDPPLQLTYKQAEQEILDFAEGLRAVGVKPDEKLSLFADNSCRWMIADQGIMATGAINVVRGSRSSVEELLQIYKHSDSNALVVDNPDLFNRIGESFRSKAKMKFIILLWGDKLVMPREVLATLPVYNYEEIIEFGRLNRSHLLESHDARKRYTYEAISSDDIATLIYTSGTSGNPKGVMLTHRNLLHQITNFWDVIPAQAGDRFLSMLPPWHAYERACEYFVISRGAELAYTTVINLKEDLRNYQPYYLLSVPLIYETLYKGIQRQISSGSVFRKMVALMFIKISLAYMEFKRVYEGKCLTKNQKEQSFLAIVVDWLWARTMASILWPIHILAQMLIYSKIRSAIGIVKAGVSGGGSLPLYVDKFFEAIGIRVQNGYGLTETAPVVACRKPSLNVLGSVGHPLKSTEVNIADDETNEFLTPGTKGIVKVRGPQVMKGYYKNTSATKQVIDEDGWFSTGDLGWIVPYHSAGRSRLSSGILVLEGRAKDTIVLSTGENVEPSELEEAAIRSSVIQQIVVIGQDQRRLGALIVPNKEEALLAAKKQSIVEADAIEVSKDKLARLLNDELRTWTTGCSFQIGPMLILDEPFTVDNGLMTPTLKIRRDMVASRYKDQIADLYK